jgi:hypothetical protein
MGFFDTLTNLFSTQPAQDAAAAQGAGIQAGYGQLSDLLGQGRSALTSNYSAGLQPFMQNYQQSQAGTGALGNALGLNGPQGNASATAAFWNNPAIQSQLDIGNQNVLRNQAATGQLNSGKTNVDLQKFGQQTASQGWNDYISRLQPYLNYSQGAAQGIGGLYGDLGTKLAGSFGNQGNAAYGAQTGIGNANANADLAAYNASGNFWNTLLGGGNLLAGIAGGPAGAVIGSGVGKLGTSLFNQFGGGGGAATGQPSLGPFPTGTWSDRRLKENIEPVGELYDGLKVYRYRYKGDERPQIGLIAQDVEKARPDTVIDIGGFKMVDYGRATDFASRLMKMAA